MTVCHVVIDKNGDVSAPAVAWAFNEEDSEEVSYFPLADVDAFTATHGKDRIIGIDDLQAQTVYILDKISASLEALGASMNDVIRTRIYLKDAANWEMVSRVHGRYFADCLPSNTLIEVSNLVGEYDVEIEAEAVVG